MGYRPEEREKSFEDVPFFVPDTAKWPDGVRPVGMEELDNLGINRSGVLHWNGNILTIERRLSLSFWQKCTQVIVTAMAALVSISTIVQGVAAYNSWACTVKWPGICPWGSP